MTRTLLLLPLLVGCAAPVSMEGTVTLARDDDTPLAGATVEVLDGDAQPFAEATTDANGAFVVDAPRLSEIVVVVSGEGTVPVAFAGQSGNLDVFEVPDDRLWGVDPDEITALRTTFEGCPGAEEGEGIVFGEVRLSLPIDDPTQGPIEAYGFVFVEDRDAEDPSLTRRDACYLDEAGTYDADAVVVGPVGRFALFGITGGPLALTIGRGAAGGTVRGSETTYVPPGGVVAKFPALAPF